MALINGFIEKNGANVDKVQALIRKAFDKITKQTGVKLTMGRVRYDNLTFHCKLEAQIVGANAPNPGDILPVDKANWDSYHSLFGMKAEDLGKTFTSHTGDKCKITGLNLKRKKKYPIKVYNITTGENRIWSVELVKASLKKK